MQTAVVVLPFVNQSRTTDECIYGLDAMQSVWYVHNKGHQVASHTWRHVDLTTLTWDKSKWTIDSRIALLKGICCS